MNRVYIYENIAGVLTCHGIDIQNMSSNILRLQQCLCSPKLTFGIQLRWLHDFDPGLSDIFEDQINYQKRNQNWNEFKIRFLQDFLTWCARNPPLSETDFSDAAPMAPRFRSWIVRYIWRSDQLSEAKSELKWIQNQISPGFSYLMHSKPSAPHSWKEHYSSASIRVLHLQ